MVEKNGEFINYILESLLQIPLLLPPLEVHAPKNKCNEKKSHLLNCNDDQHHRQQKLKPSHHFSNVNPLTKAYINLFIYFTNH